MTTSSTTRRARRGTHGARDRRGVAARDRRCSTWTALVLEVNPAMERLLDYGRAEIVGNPCAPFTHPDDHEAELPFLEAVLEGASDGYTIEKRYLRRDGEPVWARLELRLIRDEQGEPLRLLALIEDISERRRLDDDQKRLTEQLIEHSDSLQRALTAAEQADEQVRTILECITDGFVALDPDWRYSYVNKRAGEMFGRTPEELLGKHIWEEFPDGVDQPFGEGVPRGDGGADDDLPRGLLRAVGPLVREPHLRLARRHRHLLHRHHRAEARRGGRAAAAGAGRGAADGERRAHAHARSRGGARRAARLADAVRPVHERERAAERRLAARRRRAARRRAARPADVAEAPARPAPASARAAGARGGADRRDRRQRARSRRRAAPRAGAGAELDRRAAARRRAGDRPLLARELAAGRRSARPTSTGPRR